MCLVTVFTQLVAFGCYGAEKVIQSSCEGLFFFLFRESVGKLQGPQFGSLRPFQNGEMNSDSMRLAPRLEFGAVKDN